MLKKLIQKVKILLKLESNQDELIREMIEFYGEDKLPDMIRYPKTFEFYIKSFLYQKGLLHKI